MENMAGRRTARSKMMAQTALYDRLTGKHIVLRKAREEDCLSMLKHVWGDEDVYRWMLYQPTFTEAEALDRCRRSIQYQKDHMAWFVALKGTDEAVGLCAIRETAPGHYEEAGICIGKAFQGKGYGKEIVSLLLQLIFHELGAEDCRYGYFQDNIKSKKIAEHFGFVYDRTEELVRPWDGSLKKIDSCILTRGRFLENLRQSGATSAMVHIKRTNGTMLKSNSGTGQTERSQDCHI